VLPEEPPLGIGVGVSDAVDVVRRVAEEDPGAGDALVVDGVRVGRQFSPAEPTPPVFGREVGVVGALNVEERAKVL
jgi:hypothetical protein